MDKETLSNYGWITIAVLILAVMIALATPFGKYVSNGYKATYEGLGDTNNQVMGMLKVHPTVTYYQPYVGEASYGKVEFIFHEDGAVDVYGEDDYCEWGKIYEPNSAIYAKGEFTLEGATFKINEDGTITTDMFWGESLVLTKNKVAQKPLQFDKAYAYHIGNNSYFKFTFRANDSVEYEQLTEQTGLVIETFQSDRFEIYSDYFNLAYEISNPNQVYRCAIHPSGEKVIINSNIHYIED